MGVNGDGKPSDGSSSRSSRVDGPPGALVARAMELLPSLSQPFPSPTLGLSPTADDPRPKLGAPDR